VKAVQELNTKIERLDHENKELKEQNKRLLLLEQQVQHLLKQMESNPTNKQ
jgi:hypothetical protein